MNFAPVSVICFVIVQQTAMKKTAFLFCIPFAFVLGFAARTFLPMTNSKPPKKVTGIGGIFFKCKDPKKMKDWYREHLGLQTGPYGTVFVWYQGADSTKKGFTQWSPFKESTTYFQPSTKEFMINYRVENLEALVEELKKDSVQVVDKIESYEYGKFVHIMDPEQNKIELWEPVDSVYGKIPGATTK